MKPNKAWSQIEIDAIAERLCKYSEEMSNRLFLLVALCALEHEYPNADDALRTLTELEKDCLDESNV